MKRFTLFACIALCALLLSSSLAARSVAYERAALQQSGVKKGAEPSAPMVREIDVEGLKKLLARDGKQARPLLINFWATWCEPCRAEFPDLVKIDNEYRGRNLDFVIVSIDDVSEINTSVPGFLKEMRATMPAYLLNTLEPEAAINYVDPKWGGSLPATFLYDAQGKVVFKHMGRINADELRSAIKAVISDK
jgi:thiol-disulfide isomerase/thioredoxin